MANSERTDAASNIYRPYVDFSAANPTLLNPYLPPEGFNAGLLPLNTSEVQQKADSGTLFTYALIKFLTSALSCPFEVSRTLLQIQHLPISPRRNIEEESDSDHSSEESDDESFSQQKRSKEEASSSTIAPGKTVATDQYGYIVESSDDRATLPPHQLLLRSGIWNTIKTIVRHPDEGFFSLWKGQFIYWLQDMGQLFLQPTIEGSLNDAFNLYDDTIPLVHLDSVGPNIATLLFSYLATGIILNPLEIVRTRLVAQTSKPSLAKYQGTIHAVKTIIEEEGVETLFWGKDIVPCALQNIIDPFFQHCIPLIIDRCFHLTFSESPFAFSLVELALNTLQLALSIPLETVRKRLQIQGNSKVASPKPFVTAVRTRQIAYTGVIDCAYRVVTEEAFPSPHNPKIRSASFYTPHGMGALYKGFSFDFKSSVATTVISSFTGVREDGDW